VIFRTLSYLRIVHISDFGSCHCVYIVQSSHLAARVLITDLGLLT